MIMVHGVIALFLMSFGPLILTAFVLKELKIDEKKLSEQKPEKIRKRSPKDYSV